MKEAFINKRFNPASAAMIASANQILAEYFKKGFTMTLRQLHYQFVSRDLYANTQQNYKKLGSVMSDARLAGHVDWAMMEDRLRSVQSLSSWDSPSDIVEAVARQYRVDLWEGQEYRPEVWIEKDALAGVIENVCHEFRVPFFACRGYVSQSAQYEASKRMLGHFNDNQTPIVFHLGDHDPSGLDMSRENRDKFKLLTGQNVELRRLALNFDQVEEYSPPPNPAKMTDTRATDYVAQYGDESWELDALSPEVIEGLIRDAISPLRNVSRWNKQVAKEKEGQKQLKAVSDNWQSIVGDL